MLCSIFYQNHTGSSRLFKDEKTQLSSKTEELGASLQDCSIY